MSLVPAFVRKPFAQRKLGRYALSRHGVETLEAIVVTATVATAAIVLVKIFTDTETGLGGIITGILSSLGSLATFF
ncbi:MAG: hypothetical protein ABIO70_23295 [Pseudomonadota bacterium]